jgi:hypothetical protein
MHVRAQVCSAYGAEAIGRCLAWVTENLPKAKLQPAQTLAEQRASHNDALAHTDKQRYSCGSLAPKLKKGGCSDCEVSVTVAVVVVISVVAVTTVSGSVTAAGSTKSV